MRLCVKQEGDHSPALSHPQAPRPGQGLSPWGDPPGGSGELPTGQPATTTLLVAAWEPSQARGGQAHSQPINSLPGIYSQRLISQRSAHQVPHFTELFMVCATY